MKNNTTILNHGQVDIYLSDHHFKNLHDGSAISPEVIRERGYRTITALKQLTDLGFTSQQVSQQARFPGLVIPVFGTDGSNGVYMFRSDSPVSLDDKAKKLADGTYKQRVIKYVWPAGIEPRIDCSPACLDRLKDPTIPLWITEGIKKGDSLVSQGLCAVSLPNGVWGFKSKREGLVTDLDHIVWRGRLVYIIFDSDAQVKKGVDQARARLCKILSRRGADVVVVPLPAGPDKIGVDDFFARGGTVADLLAYAEIGKSLPIKTDFREKGEAESAEYLRVLADLGYGFRMNAIDDSIEVNDQPMSDPLKAEIRTKMRDAGYSRVNVIEDAYTAYAYRKQYHPIKDFLNGLSWDGQDHIGELAQYFLDDNQADWLAVWPDHVYFGSETFSLWLKKWLVGAVGKALDKNENMMLVLDGPQGCGKSFFVRWLASPIKDYFIESPVDPNDKDHRIRLMKYFIWEVAELGATTRKADREALKHFVTQVEVEERKPYGQYPTKKPALASLVGTINNEAGFLSDPTGNRRFWIVRLKSVDWNYSRKIDPRQLWAQAVSFYRRGERSRLTADEKNLQNQQNGGYMVESMAESLLLKYYHVDPQQSNHFTLTSDIILFLEEMGLKGSQTGLSRDIGSALARQGLKPVSKRVGDSVRRGYSGVWRKK